MFTFFVLALWSFNQEYLFVVIIFRICSISGHKDRLVVCFFDDRQQRNKTHLSHCRTRNLLFPGRRRGQTMPSREHEACILGNALVIRVRIVVLVPGMYAA